MIPLLFAIMAFAGCQQDSSNVKGYYDAMHYVTEGGGQLDFKLYPTDNPEELKAVISRYAFRDTVAQFNIDLNSSNTSSFSSLQKAMNNQIQINGDFRQSTLPTGSWTHIYLDSKGQEVEVTNTWLRDSLLVFGDIVRELLRK
ncbi:hypothetical protein [Microbacter margulisiae]|nr:hypothetical protein [Microbacter margulisiae]